MTKDIANKQSQMDLSHLTKGTYFIEIVNEDVSVRKIIVLK